jgi:hypothetical protein
VGDNYHEFEPEHSSEWKKLEKLNKAIPPDEWEIRKRPHWYKDPGHEEEEGIRARAKYEAEESMKIPVRVKPFVRTRRGKMEHVSGYEKQTHGIPSTSYHTPDPKVRAKLEQWGREALKRVKAGEHKGPDYKAEAEDAVKYYKRFRKLPDLLSTEAYKIASAKIKTEEEKRAHQSGGMFS